MDLRKFFFFLSDKFFFISYLDYRTVMQGLILWSGISEVCFESSAGQDGFLVYWGKRYIRSSIS